MSIISRNRLNFIDVNVFVKSSTIMRLMRMYFISSFSSFIVSRTQCSLASICFVRRWNSRFSSSAIVSWLSIQMTMKILRIACNCRSRKRNQIAFFLVSLKTTLLRGIAWGKLNPPHSEVGWGEFLRRVLISSTHLTNFEVRRVFCE